uniref:CD70 antigen n=1 Tax=Balaenoptera musculus TaxID=9771 RepID=A0A8C0HU03_BALMU
MCIISHILYIIIYIISHLYPFDIYMCMVCHAVSLNLHPSIPSPTALSGSRQDPRLRWQGSPALGRSFVHGPELDNGQLRIQRDGIYRLHIQVTLANCSFSTWTAKPHSATLTVAICFPTAHSVSLLRLSFHHGCSVASQRLTFLAHGDILCTNLTQPLLPSRNADETFFGIQWVCP